MTKFFLLSFLFALNAQAGRDDSQFALRNCSEAAATIRQASAQGDNSSIVLAKLFDQYSGNWTSSWISLGRLRQLYQAECEGIPSVD